MTRAKWALIAFVVIFVAWRALFLVYSVYVYDEEEVKTGAIARIMMDGMKLPLLEHQPGDYEGGTFLFGLLAVPYMIVFGKGYLGLKMLALTTSLLLALFSVLWIHKLEGVPGAVAAAVLWLFATPYVFQVAFIPWGNYAETAMLSAITFYLLHTTVAQGRITWLRVSALGFLFGLGVWVHYGFLVTVIVALFAWALMDLRSLFSKKLTALIGGGLVGFSPWFAYNITHYFWGLERFQDAARPASGHGKIVRVAVRLFDLFTEDIPVALHLIVENVTVTKVMSYTYYLLFVALAVALLFFLRDHIASLFRRMIPKNQDAQGRIHIARLVPFLYFFGYAFVYCWTEYGLFSTNWGDRDPETHVHIFVMLPAMIWIAAEGAGFLWRKNKIAAVLPVAAMALLGGIGQAQLIDFSTSQTWRLGTDFRNEAPVIYMEIGSKWGRKHFELDRVADRLGDKEKRSFYYGAGIKFGLDHIDSFQVGLDKCLSLPERFMPYCQMGLGTGLASAGLVETSDLEARINIAPEPVRPFVVAGAAVGAIWFGRMDHPYLQKVREIDFANLVPPIEMQAFPDFVRGHLHMAEVRPPKE